jgi:hypothetical protein
LSRFISTGTIEKQRKKKRRKRKRKGRRKRRKERKRRGFKPQKISGAAPPNPC